MCPIATVMTIMFHVKHYESCTHEVCEEALKLADSTTALKYFFLNHLWLSVVSCKPSVFNLERITLYICRTVLT